jgi:hypothetical protein
MQRCIVALLVAGCGSDAPGDLVLDAHFELVEVSGSNPSPLADIVGLPIGFSLQFANPTETFETVGGCTRRTTASVDGPFFVDDGDAKATVTDAFLGILPMWEARLELCDDVSLSSISIFTDNDAGLAVYAGCLTLPAPAIVRDADDQPTWTSFTGARCDGFVNDDLRGRMFRMDPLVLDVHAN